ncbi:MAG: hydrogenase maturation protease [Labilithrix sp.]|nr:hydrogenase maturation protease [Labilithrix sp.]
MLVVLGCGNPNRSDDGVGVVVAQALARSLAESPAREVRVFDAGTSGLDVMFRARGATKVIIVDAARSGSEPGAVFRVPGTELEATEPPPNLHGFRWDHALFAGRRIFGDAFPADVTVYLIEAASLELGLELSAPVQKAAGIVQAEIERIVQGAPLVSATPADETVRLRRGALHFQPEQVSRWFGASSGVALLYRESLLFVLPLTEATAGGMLFKLRSPRGDRVVEAQEFFRTNGLDDWGEAACTASWDEAVGGLCVRVPDSLRLSPPEEPPC